MSRGFLLDTNLPSELTRPRPEQRVRAWIASHNDLHLSVITVGELRKGFNVLPYSKRRLQLESWLDQYLLPLIGPRMLPVTQSIGDRWGALSAQRQLAGSPLSMADGLIAATALEHDLMLVTRNVKDFVGLSLTILNPWDSP